MKPGDTIIDNDPRMKGRTLVIECMVGPYGCYAKDKVGRTFSILTRRIYEDGKPRRNGFSVSGPPSPNQALPADASQGEQRHD